MESKKMLKLVQILSHQRKKLHKGQKGHDSFIFCYNSFLKTQYLALKMPISVKTKYYMFF